MSELKNHRNSYVMLGIALAIGFIVSAYILGEALKSRNYNGIYVKGLAEKTIVSNLAVWEPQVQAWSPNLSDAYAKIKQNSDKFYEFLISKGISKDEISFAGLDNTITYEKQGFEDNFARRTGYQLVQSFRIESKDVQKISRISQEASEVFSMGIELISSTPDYYYTELEKEKIELIGLATKDALRRAEELAKVAGTKVSGLKSASQGVFQVTNKHSMEVSDWGLFDTKSIEKTIKSVVSVEFYTK
ncbi:MAG TPA: SIMPL domain-containing protein [Candidatus Kapabacteria bacterium]|nr:SIMPL domain-containing protein [Candidatus Kapabacteria bacterium]